MICTIHQQISFITSKISVSWTAITLFADAKVGDNHLIIFARLSSLKNMWIDSLRFLRFAEDQMRFA